MAMEMRQELKLSQQLVMTPQLQQAIKLLQLSRMELADLVHDEMLENPVLEDGVESSAEQTKENQTTAAEQADSAAERIGETELPMMDASPEKAESTTEVKPDG